VDVGAGGLDQIYFQLQMLYAANSNACPGCRDEMKLWTGAYQIDQNCGSYQSIDGLRGNSRKRVSGTILPGIQLLEGTLSWRIAKRRMHA